ncbi:MAG: oligoribonuclease [Chloroflexi bacterium]|nr:oligoribonuclease [Chloroflexota bacterium]|tara:strand:- start:236 stop:811 length:576 start_codon:yes stop_codon:yes gene_type:complete
MLHPSQNNLIWIDLEMTGLGDKNVILEIAVIITDEKLNITDKFPNSKLGLAINRTKKELKTIESWSLNQHTKSGLLKRVEESNCSLNDAEDLVFKFISERIKPNKGILCGNSIWVDRKFLRKEMPKLEEYLFYRMIDVSSIKELVQRWYPETKFPEKNKTHLAMEDIEESIEELKWLRQYFFTNPDYIGSS